MDLEPLELLLTFCGLMFIIAVCLCLVATMCSPSDEEDAAERPDFDTEYL